MTHTVDELRLVVINVANDLAGDDRWLDAILLLQFERIQDRRACLANLGLRFRVYLQHAELPLDDLHTWHHAIAFQRDVGDAVDFDAGSDFDIQRGHPLCRQEALRNRCRERCKLGLHAVEETIGS